MVNMYVTVVASELKPGDCIYNSQALNRRYTWCRIRRVRTIVTKFRCEGGSEVSAQAVEVDAGFTTIYHVREGVYVMRVRV